MYDKKAFGNNVMFPFLKSMIRISFIMSRCREGGREREREGEREEIITREIITLPST